MNRIGRSTPDASIQATYLVFSVAFLSFLTVSCTPDASRGATATVTDSAGVTIVENSGPPPPRRRWLGRVPSTIPLHRHG
jgi:hypothetical protein